MVFNNVIKISKTELITYQETNSNIQAIRKQTEIHYSLENVATFSPQTNQGYCRTLDGTTRHAAPRTHGPRNTAGNAAITAPRTQYSPYTSYKHAADPDFVAATEETR